VLREIFDSSLRAGRHVLEALGYDPEQAAEAELAFARHERESMRELAGLWQPDLSIAENEAYLARVRELEEELEATLAERLSRSRGSGDLTP
jgi:CPA2 family monovalent cation:H+ antiporter-2